MIERAIVRHCRGLGTEELLVERIRADRQVRKLRRSKFVFGAWLSTLASQFFQSVSIPRLASGDLELIAIVGMASLSAMYVCFDHWETIETLRIKTVDRLLDFGRNSLEEDKPQ